MKKFIWEAIRDFKTIGAVLPSSKYLAIAMANASNLDNAKMILELGGGTGVITRAIVAKMPSRSNLFVVEQSEGFARMLETEFPKARVICDDLMKINFPELLATCGQNRALVGEGSEVKPSFCSVISGLPWASFPEDLQDKLLQSFIPYISRDGVFVLFAYWGIHKKKQAQHFYKKLCAIFKTVKRDSLVFRNVPPAIVYKCTF